MEQKFNFRRRIYESIPQYALAFLLFTNIRFEDYKMAFKER